MSEENILKNLALDIGKTVMEISHHRLIIERIGDVPLPSYATDGSNGIDLTFRHYTGDHRVIDFHSGIKVEIPYGYVGFLLPRSSWGTRYGMRLRNTTGVIDSDYRGEVIICAEFVYTPTIQEGDRVAQLVIVPAPQFEIVEGFVNETARGEGGFGSTGA